MLHTLSIFILIIVSMIYQKPSTMIIAHRGVSHDAPENTLASVNLAWERNADAAEVDVHQSKDNRIMVIHDGDTKRTTGKKMVIRESMSPALRSLDASNGMDQFKGERIPFLEEVIATVPNGKILFIEVKTDTVIIPYLVEVLASSPNKSRLVVISFDFDVSKIEDLAKGGFQEILDDDVAKTKVDTIVLCSGKFYYEAKEEAANRKVTNAAFIRVEQMYPFPTKQLDAVLKTYKNAKNFVWAQEEPENMGPWRYMAMALRDMNLQVVARRSSAAPATGSSATHKRRLAKLFNNLFDKIAGK